MGELTYACRPSQVKMGTLGGGPAIIGSRLKNAEREAVTAAIVVACLQEDRWQPVNAQEWGRQVANSIVYQIFPKQVINAMWAMAKDNLIRIDQTVNPQTITPTPEPVELIK